MFTQIDKSQTLLLNEQSLFRERSGKEVFKLGFGQSPFLPPEDAMLALQESAHRKDYSPVKGLPELCEAAAVFHTHYMQHTIDAADVLICPGSKIAIYNTMLAFEKADVLIPAPSWVSYAPQAKLIGHTPHFIATDFSTRWRITPETLEAAIKQGQHPSKILILNYPGNPDGLTYSADELKALAAVCKQHGVWVISDEIYGLLHHKGEHVSLTEFYPERTFITTGLSKWCGAGGWRLGVHILPKDLPEALREALLGIASETYSCAPTPVQVAACSAYQIGEEKDRYLQKQRHILSTIGNHIHGKLSGAGINVHAPQGGFYLLLDFSPLKPFFAEKNIQTDEQLCSTLIEETGVAILPGNAFGMPSDMLTARLAYVDFDGPTLMANASPSETGIMEQCAHMLKGIDRLREWVNNK